MNFERIPIPADLDHTRQSAYGFNIERTDASDPPTCGTGFDLSRRPLRNNFAMIDHDHPVGKGVGFLNALMFGVIAVFIAGLMIAFSNLRSITLNVSDCFDPVCVPKTISEFY